MTPKLPDDFYVVIPTNNAQESLCGDKVEALDAMIRHGEAGEPFRILHMAMDVETNMSEAFDDVTEDFIRERMDDLFDPRSWYSYNVPTWLIDLDTDYFFQLKNDEAA